MFVTEVGAVITTVLAVAHPSQFGWLIAGWLWLTVLFGNLAERSRRVVVAPKRIRCGEPASRPLPGGGLAMIVILPWS
jgi:hypothetical protein